jgi:hypothetical protein
VSAIPRKLVKLGQADCTEIRSVHLNHTSPALQAGSPVRRDIERADFHARARLISRDSRWQIAHWAMFPRRAGCSAFAIPSLVGEGRTARKPRRYRWAAVYPTTLIISAAFFRSISA